MITLILDRKRISWLNGARRFEGSRAFYRSASPRKRDGRNLKVRHAFPSSDLFLAPKDIV
jgi:hypothetical protein